MSQSVAWPKDDMETCGRDGRRNGSEMLGIGGLHGALMVAAAGKWMLAAAGTWLMQAATGRSCRSGKRSDEGLALFLGRDRGSRPRRLAAAGDGAGRWRQVPRAHAAVGSLLQMTSLHGVVESEIYCKTWLCGQVLNFR